MDPVPFRICNPLNQPLKLFSPLFFIQFPTLGDNTDLLPHGLFESRDVAHKSYCRTKCTPHVFSLLSPHPLPVPRFKNRRMPSQNTRPRWIAPWINSMFASSQVNSHFLNDPRVRRILSAFSGDGSNGGYGEDELRVSTTRRTILETLPQDVLLQILTHSDVQDIIRIAKVSH